MYICLKKNNFFINPGIIFENNLSKDIDNLLLKGRNIEVVYFNISKLFFLNSLSILEVDKNL